MQHAQTLTSILAVCAILLATHLVPRSAWAQGSRHSFSVQPLHAMPVTADSGIEGATTLMRSPDGLEMTLSATGLEPFHVYTVWWIIFHDPWYCENPVDGFGACSAPDLDNKSNTAVLRAAGAIADASGTISVSGHLEKGLPPQGLPVRGQLKWPVPLLTGIEFLVGFWPDSDIWPWLAPSEVHVALAEHPAVDPATVVWEITNPGPVIAASIFTY